MASKKRTLYVLEGRSWSGCKITLLHFRTRLELTGAFLRRVVKQLGGVGIRKVK